MTSDVGEIRTPVSWLVVVALVAQAPAAVRGWLTTPDAFVPGAAPLVLGCLAGAVAWLVWRAASGLSVTGALRALVTVSVLGLLAQPWVMADPRVDPPLIPLLVTGACASVLLSAREALAVVPVVAVAAAWLRRPVVDPTTAVGTGVLPVVAALAALAVVRAVARAHGAVPAAVAAGWDAAEEHARVTERAKDREVWDGLVHDKVLGALAAAAPGPVPAVARELAEDALGFLRGLARPESSLETRWRRHAERLGLEVDVTVVEDGADADVREALAGAVEEALTNVRRHSGQRAATVTAELGEDAARAVVTDRGVGISGAAGVGVRLGIEARMRAVGGHAEIGPADGGGTAVVLAWPGPAPEPPAPPRRRGPRAMPVVAALVMAAVLGPVLVDGGAAHVARVGDVAALVLAVLAAGWIVRSVLVDAHETVEAMTARAGELRVALAVEGDRQRQAAARASALDAAVGGALELLRDAPAIDAAQAAALGRLGSTTRDRLAAPDLVDDALACALTTARDAGARVDVVPGHLPSAVDADAAGADTARALRVVLRAVLDAVGPGSAVRVTWAPGGVSTVAVVGPGDGLAERLRALAGTRADQVAVTVDGDEEALLVELAPRVPGQAGSTYRYISR